MLVLSRRLQETIHIGDDITIVVGRISKGRVSLKIEAPQAVKIRRGELPAEIGSDRMTQPTISNANLNMAASVALLPR